jgi:hypothetical protein
MLQHDLSILPAGNAPQPVALPHFPSRLHAFIWRNWQLIPTARLVEVAGARPEDILRLGQAMGLAGPPPITADLQKRTAITVIRRNWHLLPYEQLLQLLGWTADELAFSLREDDFLYLKLGAHKPQCEPVRYADYRDDAATRQGEQAIAALVREQFPDGLGLFDEPLFSFVEQLAQPLTAAEQTSLEAVANAPSVFEPRFCSSYFALYGDPLLDEGLSSYPDGYLERLRACGVDGVWIQAVLYKLVPFPWEPALSERYEERQANLRALVERARRHGLGVFLYLNEPRAMPLAFFQQYPELKGIEEHDHGTMCTSHPAVQAYLTDGVAELTRAVPGIAGYFTITASENLTNCWSHTVSNNIGTNSGDHCPRCGQRTAPEVIAEVNALIHAGIRAGGSEAPLLVWDWAWDHHGDPIDNNWAEEIIKRLPPDVRFMSISEWNIPIHRGGQDSVIGEYALSVVGPGPRAQKHWGFARERGIKVVAKVQLGNTWELSAVPYVPVVASVAQHMLNLREEGIDGLMLGWTLGGYPSPNLEVMAEVGRADRPAPDVDAALLAVAQRRYGDAAAPDVVEAWRRFSEAFTEFPFNIWLIYTAPMNYGPSNLFWEAPTGYYATMLGYCYDALPQWCGPWTPAAFAEQFEKIVAGWEPGITALRQSLEVAPASHRAALEAELRVAEASVLHFASVANQTRFVAARNALSEAANANDATAHIDAMERLLQDELDIARRLHAIQSADSRIGFESSNQYYYVPVDLAEKVLNCHDLLTRWLPAQREKWG